MTVEKISNIIKIKRKLSYGVHELWIENSLISKQAKPGQFVIVRTSEKGERIPLTIVDVNGEDLRIVVKAVGKSTYELCALKEKDKLYDVVGPLGKPSEVKHYGNVLVIGGGVGIAAVLPIAKALKNMENRITVIIGSRTAQDLILKDEFTFADKLVLTTDDGSIGYRGTVIDAMKTELGSENYNIIWSIGPALMMKYSSEVAKTYNIPIWVSLNSIMIDGTGMCGGCRTVIKTENLEEIKYVCVDGPEFDGRYVDWDSFIKRLNQYKQQEKLSLEKYLREVGEPTWL
ncbi:MAG: sulfide/dihydroorotate dehydrogenase-like FAD/NAD-binding protein [Fervidobacterium sp.]